MGGNPDVDVNYRYLTFMLDDEEELAKMYNVSADVDSGPDSKFTGRIKYRIIRRERC